LFYMNSMSDQLPAAQPTYSQPAVQQQQQRSTLSPVEAPAAAAAAAPQPSTSSHSTHSTAYGAASAQHVQQSEQQQAPAAVAPARRGTGDDIGEDALAAYSFLDQPPSPVVRQRSLQGGSSSPSGAGIAAPAVAAPVIAAPAARTPAGNFPSTFGKNNNKAAERKTAAQLQALAHQEAMNKPGRAGGKKKTMAKGPRSHAWGEESSEDDDEEEEEDEEDEVPLPRSRQPSTGMVPSPRNGTPVASGPPSTYNSNDSAQQQQLLAEQHQYYLEQQQQRAAASAYGTPGSLDPAQYGGDSRSRSISPGAAQTRASRPGGPSGLLAQQQRMSVFNSHLSHNDGGASPQNSGSASGDVPAPGRNTFVQLAAEEQPGAMTTVFQPHGLLQAGAQDKAERSAKNQEMDARMSGNHMVNVPNKPPPPQAGLLGAITAHERDRKAAGGYGATLTERERERVAAERRQREEDNMRQQQQQMMMAGGGQWGGMPSMPSFNPMMWQQVSFACFLHYVLRPWLTPLACAL
jgi:CCR4-NOT transcriptional complex subunit CAF120